MSRAVREPCSTTLTAQARRGAGAEKPVRRIAGRPPRLSAGHPRTPRAAVGPVRSPLARGAPHERRKTKAFVAGLRLEGFAAPFVFGLETARSTAFTIATESSTRSGPAASGRRRAPGTPRLPAASRRPPYAPARPAPPPTSTPDWRTASPRDPARPRATPNTLRRRPEPGTGIPPSASKSASDRKRRRVNGRRRSPAFPRQGPARRRSTSAARSGRNAFAIGEYSEGFGMLNQ